MQILVSFIIFSCVVILNVFATDPYPRNHSIDIKHYRFTIELNDSTNLIEAAAEITILFKKSVRVFSLDLIERSMDGNGMLVSSVRYKESPLMFSHKNDRLEINLSTQSKENEQITVTINYRGIPSDGLAIGTNKFGDRTFFGDNWPDRARYWLPSIDHPYDKASCEFIVIAPDHYQVIANGTQIEKTNLSKNQVLTHWKEVADIPTKVMVIGVARFATTLAGVINGIPVETWVYPQNKEEGVLDFIVATKVLDYFVNQIGPFPYQKLANVQSTTRYGGMENASNIFYFENSVNGKNERESLIAHEIAHQWFGDSASEMDWYHVWLSEGFATYFTNLYYEYTYGKDQLADRMKTQREEVIQYNQEQPAPVIDTTIIDINKVLNTNSYQKGSWALHMLRREVGDDAFWRGIREYYKTYQHGNALTMDFRWIMEKASGKDLEVFFDQWLWKSGHPILSGSWTYLPKRKIVKMIVRQNQPTLFAAQLEIGLKGADGTISKQTIQLTGKEEKFTFSAEKRPNELLLDPDTWLLFEGKILPK